MTVQGSPVSISYKEHFSNLVKVAEALSFGFSEHYRSSGLTYVDAPEIVGITGACENVDTLFRVKGKKDIPLFFTQTGQLSLEQALQSFSGVFTVIHSGRDEDKEDSRHLRQFRLTEEEFDCTMIGMTRDSYDEDAMYEALLSHIEAAIKSGISSVLKCTPEILERYGRDISTLENAIIQDFHRISYEDSIKLLNDNGYPELVFGDDLKEHHEAEIIKLMNSSEPRLPVFIMKYPEEIKFFNMKEYTKDPKVVLSADLILPYSGESVGSAVREHDYEKLNDRLLRSTMYSLHVKRGGSYKDYEWYLDIMKNKKTNPHAGYGIGNERVLQYIFGEIDIRNVSVFSLLNIQNRDWEKK